MPNPVLVNTIVQAPTLIGTFGLWFQARKRRIAPALGALSEVAWVVWAVIDQAWSLIPWCVLWGALYIRTWIYWEHDEKGKKVKTDGG